MTSIFLPRHTNDFQISSEYSKKMTEDIHDITVTYLSKIRENLLKFPNMYETIQASNIMMNHTNKLTGHYNTPVFYTYTEIFQAWLSQAHQGMPCKILLFTLHNEMLMNCIKHVRHIHSDSDEFFMFDLNKKPFSRNEIYKFNRLKSIYENSIDLLVFDLSHMFEDYSKTLIGIVCNILDYQKMNGLCIIKLGDIYHKPILDIIYILNYFYKKVVIMTPTINIDEKYLICIDYCLADYSVHLSKLESILREMPNEKLTSLIPNELPLYFLNKINDFNVSACSNQIAVYDQILSMNLCKRSASEKEEEHKNAAIQKCIQWCEKHKIPHHKQPETFLFNRKFSTSSFKLSSF